MFVDLLVEMLMGIEKGLASMSLVSWEIQIRGFGSVGDS